MYIDTHAHLYLKHFNQDIDKVVHDARLKDIEHIYLPNIDRMSSPHMLKLEEKYPDFFSSMIGVHPGSIREDFELELQHVEEELRKGGFVAIGEIGTDLYWEENKKYKAEQIIAFNQQMKWALEYQLPIVIHARESLDITIDLVEKMQDGKLKGVFHCFTGTVEQAERIMDLGFYLGIGGVLTYRNSGLKAVVSQLPLDFLVLETDAPFLPPIPHRGKRNESAYIPLIAQHLADALNCSVKEVAEVSTENAKVLFGAKNV